MTKRLPIFVWMVFQVLFGLRAQPECTITHYDEFSGMAQWYVTQIVQDKQGMMWFATWNGLNRYDGYEFQCFKSQAGDGVDIPSDRMRDMILDDDGNLICRFDDRVFLFDIRDCRYRNIPADEEARHLAEFDRRERWQLANVYTPIEFKDHYGTSWKIFHDGRLQYFDKLKGQWTDNPVGIQPVKDPYFSMIDKEGDVWICSGFGAHKLSFRQKPYKMFPQENKEQIRCFYLDNRRRYWVTSRNDATVRLFDEKNRLLGYLGRDGRLHPQYVSFGSSVYCMLQDHDGTFWLGSKPDGLFRLKEQPGGTFSIEQFCHQKGNPLSMSSGSVYWIAEDGHHRLWLATFDGGVNCIEHPEAAQLRFLHYANGLHYPGDNMAMRTRHILITKDNILLAATTTGLLVADISPQNAGDVRFRLHQRDANRVKSLSNNAVMFVAADRKGRLFVCTESGGVNQLLSGNLLEDELDFRHYNTQTGFPTDVALSAYPTRKGLAVVSNTKVVELLSDEDQIVDYDPHLWREKFRFSDAVPLLLPDGHRLFGLQNGAFVVDPSSLERSRFVPPIALTGISIQGQVTNRAVSYVDTLTLSPPDRSFTVYFAALDYASDGPISYAFQLSGGGDQWNYIKEDHSITLLDMQPGTYSLKIRSTNRDGVWVDNMCTLTIIVKPTFWETPWAKAFYLLLFILLVLAILYTRRYIRRINRKQRELHEAYLALLNAREAMPEQAATVAAPPSMAQPQLKPEDEAFMRRAMQFIEAHIGDADVNIGDMADATATSRSGLNRKMKSLLGVTPLDFIREARIQKACQMLQTGASVNDVAYACGFSDPKYFGKCFKTDMGMTPTEYKAQISAS